MNAINMTAIDISAEVKEEAMSARTAGGCGENEHAIQDRMYSSSGESVHQYLKFHL